MGKSLIWKIKKRRLFGHRFFERNENVSFCGLANLWLADAADRSETLLELVDTTFGVYELFLSSEERMGIGSDTSGNHGVLNTIDHFFFF